MRHAELLARLLPPAAYDPQAPRLNAELTAEGSAIDAALDYAGRVTDAITPYRGELLTDWERVVGITLDAGKPAAARVEAVVAKLRETGGLSRQYFINLAAGLGYTISLTEFHPFRAGTSRAGDPIYIERVIWVWRVNVAASQTAVYRFQAGISRAGEALMSFGDPVIESVFQDLKPAHTYVYFAYQ